MRECPIKHYRLVIEIDVFEMNPQDAARQGWRTLANPQASLPVVMVRDLTATEDTTLRNMTLPVIVDLEEIGMDAFVKRSNPVRHPSCTVETQKGFPTCIYLSNGTKITVGRDKRTHGPAWLKVEDQLAIGVQHAESTD